MQPDRIIEPFDIREDVCFCLLPCFVVLMMDPLIFQRAPETLHDRIIPAVAFSAHTDLDLLVSK